MTAFDGKSSRFLVFFDGNEPAQGKIYVADRECYDRNLADDLSPAQAIELAEDLISAANIRLGEQGLAPYSFPERVERPRVVIYDEVGGVRENSRPS